MIICVANTTPEKVRKQLEKRGVSFSMWKNNERCEPENIYGFFNYEDIKKSKVKSTPIFFNIVSAFNHIEINHLIFRYDYRELPTGLVLFEEPNMKKVVKELQKKFKVSSLKDVMFKPAKVSSHEGSELARRWNNFILTLPSCVSETFMVCFLSCVRKDDKDAFHAFVVDNRLIGTGNKAAYVELDAIIRCMWPIMHASAMKTEKMVKMKKKFLDKNPDLESSLSRFLFWNRSYKGKHLSDYMDDENNVAYGIKE